MNKAKENKAANPGVILRWLGAVVLAAMSCTVLSAAGVGDELVKHNTPSYVFTSQIVGSEDPSKTMDVSIWLKPHDHAGLDTLASQLYDPASPNYRRFLSPSEFAARFAPTADEAKAVQQFFESHNLKVVNVGPDNLFVRARGTVRDVQSTFHVQLYNYQVGDKILRANDRDPYIDGPAASLMQSVSGLDTGQYEHPRAARHPSPTISADAAAGSQTQSKASKTSSFFSNNCFNGLETETFSTNNNGSFPIGTYSGNHLNRQSLTSPGCGYTPPEIQTAYNLTALYKEGHGKVRYDGTGQTIGIVDFCGSSTIESDANAFSAYFGLPALTSSNFTITYTPQPSLCIATGQVEINLDVEWAHAVAPGAKINLIISPSAGFQDVDQAEVTGIVNGLANVISGSFGAEEVIVAPSEIQNGNLIAEMGDVLGIGSNFSTGDQGDFTAGFSGFPPTVQYPADSPFATGVGGVTLALKPDNTIAWQSGWGNNIAQLSSSGFVFDPPLDLGFQGGSGGGPSNCAFQNDFGGCLGGFPKPAYQSQLPGNSRQLPDVSWLADPNTGGAILISEASPFINQLPLQVWQTVGGTSLACPMFSALWAIANQEAQAGGGRPLGQAAPYLYSMPAGTIFDIVPQTSTTNVTASIQESPTTTINYTAFQVAGGSDAGVGGIAGGPFISAIYDDPTVFQDGLVYTFGTDTLLTTAEGWDNVTGVGTPNAKAFADYFFGK